MLFRSHVEDEMQHPELEQPLIDKLVVLANPRHGFQVGLRSAAVKVLNNYELDTEGNPVRSPQAATRRAVVWGFATVLRSAVSSIATQLKGTSSLMLNIKNRDIRICTGQLNRPRSSNYHISSLLESVKGVSPLSETLGCVKR